MTTRPRLYGGDKAAGLLAVALFAVLTAVFVTAEFDEMAGFGGAQDITAAIGYAMFDMAAGSVPSEGFLVAFEIVDVLLVAALVGAVMLARRESEGGFLPLTEGAGRRPGGETRSDGGTSGETDEPRDGGADTPAAGGDR